jgi:hypothetical protein
MGKILKKLTTLKWIIGLGFIGMAILVTLLKFIS